MTKKKNGSKKNAKSISFHDREAEFDEVVVEILNAVTKIKRVTYKEVHQMNANFIYLLAIFDRFIGHLNIFGVQNSKAIKDKYINMFTSLCNEKVKSLNKGQEEWTKFYNRPTQMIKSYSLIEKEKNGLVILRELLKDEVRFTEKTLQRELKRYYEARARRNLLVHRGRRPDKFYYDELNKSKIDDKTIELAHKLTYSKSSIRGDEEDEYSGKKRENPSDNPIDLSVTPAYLRHICMALIYIKESLLMDLNHQDLKTNLHDYIVYAIVNNDVLILSTLKDLFMRKIDSLDNMHNLSIDEKVNFIILMESIFDKKIIKRDKDFKESHETLIESIKEEDHEWAVYIKPLLMSYLHKNQDEFFHNTKAFLDSDPDVIIKVQNWLIFKRYLRYKRFKELFRLKRKEFIDFLKKEIKKEKS